MTVEVAVISARIVVLWKVPDVYVSVTVEKSDEVLVTGTACRLQAELITSAYNMLVSCMAKIQIYGLTRECCKRCRCGISTNHVVIEVNGS